MKRLKSKKTSSKQDSLKGWRYITRNLISSRESVGKNGQPKTIYNYEFKYDNDKKINQQDLEYVKSLAIPNKINNKSLRIFPKGNRVLAEYQDTKNRKIHKYSRKEIRGNVEAKFKRVRAFLKSSPDILARILKDLRPRDENRRSKNSQFKTSQKTLSKVSRSSETESRNTTANKTKQAALILYIISKTGLRVGSNSDTKSEVKAYGISTLLNKHVTLLPDNKIKFKFIGKKGVLNSSIVKDKIIWNELNKLKTTNWSEPIFNVQSGFIRNYLNKIDDRFIIKDFRTLKATEVAQKEIAKRKGPAPTEKIFKIWQKEVADKVAKELGNTRNVALNDYIDPLLWNKWRQSEWGIFTPKKLLDKD